MIRVAIFEDNRDLREGLFHLIDGTEGYQCVGAFGNCDALISHLEETRPDVVMMDIELPGISGIEGVKIAKSHFPHIKVLMETIFEDSNKIFESICNGAEGYILKNIAPVLILQSIREIYEGGAPMTPGIASKVLKMFKQKAASRTDTSYALSDREKQILRYLTDGMSYKMIATKCAIGKEMVNGHVKSIYKKLQAHSKLEETIKTMKSKIM